MDNNANRVQILSGDDIERIIRRLAHEICEKHPQLLDVVIIGIQTRGVYLAQRLRQTLRSIENVEIPFGILGITLYRDDLTVIGPKPVVKKTKITFDINDKKIILVDDVLFTGRTVRAALDELMDFGRAKTVELLVLVDRGHRELPIRADYVGKNIPTAQNELVEVKLKEIDGCDEVVLRPRENL